MVRRALLAGAGGYDETLAVAQDYDLWMRLARRTRLANLAEVLVVRRLGAGRVSVEREEERLRTEARVRWRAVTSGAYPPWCALFALRPALALALPRPLRRAVRAAVPAARVSEPIPSSHVLVSTRPGGGPQHVLAVAQGLRARGWRPIVVGPADGVMFERFRAAGVETVALRADRLGR